MNLSTQQLSFSQPINLPSARLSLSATPKLVNPDDDFGTGVPDDVRGARAYCNWLALCRAHSSVVFGPTRSALLMLLSCVATVHDERVGHRSRP